MRPLHAYLALYFALVLGAAVALWQSGVLHHLPLLWSALAVGTALAAGLALLLASRPFPPGDAE